MALKCRRLLGLTSEGTRIVCGKATDWALNGNYCAQHEEFETPALISLELDQATAGKLIARADAYGVKVGDLIRRVISAGIAMGLDAEQ